MRSRIVLLAAFGCLLLALSGGALYVYFRNTEAAKVAAAQSRLTAVATRLARAYAERSDRAISLADMPPHPMPSHPPRLPPVHPPPPPRSGPPPPPHPHADPLSAITASVLRDVREVEGGFYDAADDTVGGYAFPTHEGPGEQAEMPARELPTIAQAARLAAATGKVQTLRFEGASDALLIVAAPLGGGGSAPQGAAWLMQHLPITQRGERDALLKGAAAFAAAALLTGLLAFLLIAEVQGGLDAVLLRLRGLEDDLSPRREDGRRTPLAEFGQVLAGVDRLAASLREKIEDEKQLEAQMRHSERLSALGSFAAGIAHELRNPLATIRLRAQMAGRAAGPDAQRHAEVMLAEIDRVDAMVGRLLTFARPLELRAAEFDLQALCAETVRAWREREKSRAVAVEYAGGPALPCAADSARIRQVLDNLIENALDAVAATEEPRVGVAAAAGGDRIEVRVEDNGPGIPAGVRERVFNPFFTTKETGTGLGLSISYEIVQAHGGTLELREGAGGGTCAVLRLPASGAGTHG